MKPPSFCGVRGWLNVWTRTDVELASGVLDSLAITGEAVTPLLVAQLRAFLAQSGIGLAAE